MKLRWTKEDVKYFNEKIPVVERNDDWIVWSIIAIASLSGAAYLIYYVIVN